MFPYSGILPPISPEDLPLFLRELHSGRTDKDGEDSTDEAMLTWPFRSSSPMNEEKVACFVDTCFAMSAWLFRRCSISACKTWMRSSRYWTSLCRGMAVGVSSWDRPMIRSEEIVFSWRRLPSHLPVRLAVLINEINESISCLRSRFSWFSFHFSDSIPWTNERQALEKR